MEHKFLSGVSVFDFLTMIVPGCVYIAIIGGFLGYVPFVITVSTGNFSRYLLLFVVAYLIGIVHNAVMDFIFKWFRNNACYIQSQYSKVFKYCRLSNCVLSDLNMPEIQIYPNKKGIFQSQIRSILDNFKMCFYKNKIDFYDACEFDKTMVLNGYYKAYYFVAKNSNNSSLSIMECQVAFIRNMLFPLLFMIAQFCTVLDAIGLNIECSRVAILILYILGIVSLVMVMINRQNKIYRRVFEDYVYLNMNANN